MTIRLFGALWTIDKDHGMDNINFSPNLAGSWIFELPHGFTTLLLKVVVWINLDGSPKADLYPRIFYEVYGKHITMSS
jgi:hypothetical protein